MGCFSISIAIPVPIAIFRVICYTLMPRESTLLVAMGPWDSVGLQSVGVRAIPVFLDMLMNVGVIQLVDSRPSRSLSR